MYLMIEIFFYSTRSSKFSTEKEDADTNNPDENVEKTTTGIIKVELIRTEGPLSELPEGTFFFTLYADDFIESNMKALEKGKTDEKQEKIYRIVNERFHMLTVSLTLHFQYFNYFYEKCFVYNSRFVFEPHLSSHH